MRGGAGNPKLVRELRTYWARKASVGSMIEAEEPAGSGRRERIGLGRAGGGSCSQVVV